MRIVALCVTLLAHVSAFGQAGAEILLFDLHAKKDNVTLSHPKNITNRKGYDNQPSFHAAAPIVYFASFNDDGRSDLKTYNYKTGVTTRFTQTPEREYSPLLTPDGNSISCIIQRDNGAQDLGEFPVDGGSPTVLVNYLTVGYHVWADNSHVGLFVLGKENAPHTFHYLRLPTRTDTIVAENIGRSLHRIPGETAISFVRKNATANWTIEKFDTHLHRVSLLGETLPGREDLCWTPDGKILMSDGTGLFWMDPQKDKKWKAVEMASGAELLKGVTRLAVDADGKKIAIVVAEADR